MLIRLVLILLVNAVTAGLARASYDEKLEIKPLPNNYLYASFRFETEAILAEDSRHYDILPRSLVQVARRTHASALHLRFSRGRWNQEIWGSLPRRGADAGGTGIEVWATLAPGNAEEDWKTLVNALSGLFCASMNFIDSTRTVEPQFVFRQAGRGRTFHGVLPSETVCTENLTPFLKLLPCKGHAGISSLLTGHKLFDTDWSALSVDLEFVGERVILSQKVDMVFDLERALHAARDPIPGSQPSEEVICMEGKFYTSDVTCFPQDGRAPKDWSFEQVFGKTLNGQCAVADPDKPSLIVHHGPDTRLVPNSEARTGNVSAYHLQDDRLNLQFSDRMEPALTPAPIEVRRSLTSHGSSLHGKITLAVTNKQRTNDVEVVYFSMLPWFMRPYLHTLRTSHADVITRTNYKPAKDRIRPTHLELVLSVPAGETVLVTFDFDRTVLRYAEYPPDANRGFDVP